MLLTFNKIQMHKIDIDGKRNSPSLCWYTSRPHSNTFRRQGRYDRKLLPTKAEEPFVSWISTFTGPDALRFFSVGVHQRYSSCHPHHRPCQKPLQQSIMICCNVSGRNSTTGWMCAELPRGLALNTSHVLKQNLESFSFHWYQFCASEFHWTYYFFHIVNIT
jgi:hypothetical protein